jgi:dihydrofolate synthase/folylpolyglutamate synthase
MDSLSAWLEYLESIHPKSIDMGLDRVKQVAERLAFNWDQITVITVGGTNGKGTTCRFLEYYLGEIGQSVATFRSPHLVDYRERVTLNGEMQPESEYVDAFQAVETARGDITLTYFEFGTLAALVMMQRWRPDVALLEVGLGGRLDATNIVENDCAVITTIGIDHQAFLGDTREAIAVEKAGIFRRSKPVVIGELDAPSTLDVAVSKQKGYVVRAGHEFNFETSDNTQWNWRGKNHQFTALPMPSIPVQNASTALATLEALDFPLTSERVIAACKHASLTGRRQLLSTSPFIMLDVAHNPQAAESLVSLIKTRRELSDVNVVVGMLYDKDIAATLGCFSDINVNWYLASTDGPRGCTSNQLANFLPANQRSQQFDNVLSAYDAAVANTTTDNSIFVFGSFLTVADVLAYRRASH